MTRWIVFDHYTRPTFNKPRWSCKWCNKRWENFSKHGTRIRLYFIRGTIVISLTKEKKKTHMLYKVRKVNQRFHDLEEFVRAWMIICFNEKRLVFGFLIANWSSDWWQTLVKLQRKRRKKKRWNRNDELIRNT